MITTTQSILSITMSHVQVVFRKYDGALHWHYPAFRLGEDQHGVWLGISPPAIARRGTELELTLTEPAVMLVPRSGWWTAQFCPTIEHNLYCDITTVPEWRDGTVTMVDLDLDVVRRQDGTVFLDDEDEFEAHRVAYGYPPEIVVGAKDAAEHLLAIVRSGSGPFGGAHEPWLAKVASA